MEPPQCKDVDSQDRLLSLDEVATILGGISTKSVRRLILRGKLPPAVKILKSPQLYQSDVAAYLQRLKAGRTPTKPFGST